MSAGFFSKVNQTITNSIDSMVAGYSNEYASLVMSVFGLSITIFVLVKGYMTLAGKLQEPVKDLLWEMARAMIIVIFVTDSEGMLTYSIAAIDGLKEGFASVGGGSGDIWSELDKFWLKAQVLGSTIHALDPFPMVKLDGTLAEILVWIGAIIALVAACLTFLLSYVVLKLLTITAPIFIFCLMFGFLREMFNNWLRMIFSSILTVMFSTLVVKNGMKYYSDILSQIEGQATQSNMYTMAFMALVGGVIVAALILLSKHLATGLAGAGADAAAMGIAVMTGGAMGMAAFKAGKMGLGMGLGAGKKMSDFKRGFLGTEKNRTSAHDLGKKAAQMMAARNARLQEARRRNTGE
ncbi:hypothetical protein BUE93_22145 [Chromobacterium amazonense]|uniref:Conjugal transfer protein TrbL n=1 Tax=Chromobacterium amazonense TaxID=1382803 RepID=A0A2S9WYH3_9NEIS|nr:type IV secretion system protein [Chromobacterium amazonense]PRP68504.1 hypothetical protein BUE93_22145 [Chromobacterium amazonense]